jgi:hypothetical protein
MARHACSGTGCGCRRERHTRELFREVFGRFGVNALSADPGLHTLYGVRPDE